MSIKITQKRAPKNPIKFQLTLNPEQKLAKRLILENAITVIKGKAGSGKTLVACQAALDMLFTRQVDSIIITRPTVSKEDIEEIITGHIQNNRITERLVIEFNKKRISCWYFKFRNFIIV